MKVSELRKALEGVDGDMIVVTPGRNHSFRSVYTSTVTDSIVLDYCPYEDHGGELEDGEERIKLFLIS